VGTSWNDPGDSGPACLPNSASAKNNKEKYVRVKSLLSHGVRLKRTRQWGDEKERTTHSGQSHSSTSSLVVVVMVVVVVG